MYKESWKIMNKKVREHIPSGFLMSMILSFKETKKIMIYTEVNIAWKKKKDECLKRHVRKITNFEKKILTKEQEDHIKK